MFNPPKGNLYTLKIPKNFFPTEIKSKYEDYLKHIHTPYNKVEDFATSLLQAVNLPNWEVDAVDQINASTPDFGITNRATFPTTRKINKSINLEFRSIEGYINYFLFLETFLHVNGREYKNEETNGQILPNITLATLDQRRNKIVEINYERIIFKNLSELSFDYRDVTNQNKSFTISLSYTSFSLDFGLNNKN